MINKPTVITRSLVAEETQEDLLLHPIHSTMVSPRKAANVGRNKAPVIQHRLAVSNQDVGKHARRGPRVNWDSHLTRAFLELAAKEIEEVGRGTTQLSNQSLARISQRLSSLTNLPVTPTQCKNQYQVLRRDWQAWQLLGNAKKGATSIGFDSARGTFIAPDFFWLNLIAQNEHVAKFRERPIDHEDLMHRVFEEVTATGNYVHVLAEYDTDPANPIDLEDDSNIMGTNEEGDNIMGTYQEEGDDLVDGGGNTVGLDLGDEVGSQVPVQSNDEVTPPHRRSMPKNPSQESSGTKRKTPSTGTDELSQSMNRILRTMETQDPYKNKFRTRTSMYEVTQCIDSMQFFDKSPRPRLYWWVIGYLKRNTVDADIFMAKKNGRGEAGVS